MGRQARYKGRYAKQYDYMVLKDLTIITMSYADLYEKMKDTRLKRGPRPMDLEHTLNVDKS